MIRPLPTLGSDREHLPTAFAKVRSIPVQTKFGLVTNKQVQRALEVASLRR